MADSTPVHFFDILSDVPGSSKSWSPNTLKTRIALNYKGIPYTQTYISYPDIAPLLSGMGVAPHPEGTSPFAYTLPAICHPSVKSNSSGALMDSLPIALHLDQLYPSPTLFPSGNTSYALALAVNDLLFRVAMAGFHYLAPKIAEILDPRGKEYFVRTRSAMFGKPLSEVGPKDEEGIRKVKDDMKKEMKPLLDMLRGMPEKSGPFFEGENPGYADFIFVAFMVWFKAADEDLWRELVGLGSGEIKALWDAVLPWVGGEGENKEWEITQ